MTKEEAIGFLKKFGYLHSGFSSFEAFYEDGSFYKEAVDVLETALRAQQGPAKLDRSRREGCGL